MNRLWVSPVPPHDYQAYNLTDYTQLMKAPYGLCEQTNTVMLEVLYRMNYKGAYLATPEHTSAIAEVNGIYHVVDASHEVTTLAIADYPGLFAFLPSGAARTLYPPGTAVWPVMGSLLNRYLTVDSIDSKYIFPYEGNGYFRPIEQAYRFEQWAQKAKYRFPVFLLALAVGCYFAHAFLRGRTALLPMNAMPDGYGIE
jgi:hypothetical protein